MIYILLSVLFVAVLALATRKFWLPVDRRGLNGPPPKFLIGNALEVGKAAMSGSLASFFQDAIINYGGESKTVAFSLPGGGMLVATGNAHEIKQILGTKSDNFEVRIPPFSKTVPNSIILLHHDEWKRHRKLVAAAFRPEPLANVAVVTNEVCDTALPYWLEQSSNYLNFHSEFSKFALDVVGQSTFSVKINSITSPHFRHFHEASETFTIELQHHGMMPAFLFKVMGLDSTLLEKSANTMREMIRKALSLRQAEDPSEEHKPSKTDLLDVLIHAKEEDVEPLTNAEIEDEVFTFFFAGHETSANTLCWVLYELARHPEIKAKLVQEIDEVLGSRKPEFADLSKLKYLDMVLKESLRLYPVAPHTPRVNTTEYQIAGCTVPPDTQFMLSFLTVHRDPEVFVEPMTFNPERWADEGTQLPFFSFGFGPHTCVGRRLAWTEMQVLVSRMFQLYDIALDPSVKVEEFSAATLGPKKSGLWVKLLPRSS